MKYSDIKAECDKGGQHRLAIEEGSSGFPYQYCEKCGCLWTMDGESY